MSGHIHGPNEYICDDGDCPGLLSERLEPERAAERRYANQDIEQPDPVSALAKTPPPEEK